MVRLLVTSTAALALLLVSHGVDTSSAEACGVKVSAKSSKIQRARVARTSAAERTPIAAGPVDTRTRRGAGAGDDRGVRGAGGSESAPGTSATPRAANTPRTAERPKKSPIKRTKVAQTEPTEPKQPKEREVTGMDPAGDTDTDSGADADTDSGADTGDDTVTERPASSARFTARFFFANGSASLSSGAKKKLNQNARWLAQNPDKSITVEGHANTRGNPDANQVLSEMRAQAVKDYLVSKGVDESRITVTSYGSERPEFQPGESGKNRRVVIVVD